MLVSEPAFSAPPAHGRKKTSVPTVAGSGRSGPSFQKVALSIRNRSRTTSQSSWQSAARLSLELGAPTAGFWPIRNSPFTFPSAIRLKVASCEWSSVILGIQEKPNSFSAVAASPNQALSRLTMNFGRLDQ